MRASPLLVVVLLVLLGLLASSAVDARRLPKLRSQSAALGGSGVSVSTSVSVPKLAPGRQTYGHGAVMGASLEFAQHPTWATILQVLQPAAAKQVQSLLAAISADRSGSGQAVGGLMLYLENNPTLAAYGALEHLQACTGSAQSAPSACANPLRSEWDIWLAPGSPADVSKLKISHGNKLTTVGQSLAKSSNFGWRQSDVSTAPTATEWLEIFGQAISMGRAKSTTRIDKAAATKLAASFFAAPSGLVLDTKSTYSTTADLDALVNALATQYGIHVFGVGSFIRSQISGLTATKPVYFYHTHFGLALEAQAGLVKNGDTVMFNGGSLLVQGAATPTVDPTAIAALRAVQQQYKLNVALYVQEPATSPAAATALINLTNQETALLSGGFAYGNVNGRADGLAKGDALGVQSPLYTMEKLKTQAKQVVAKTKKAVVNGFKKSVAATKVAYQRVSAPIRKAFTGK